MENIFWKAYSNGDRHLAINEIRRIVSTYAEIVDFTLFSDIALSLKIEIKEFKINKLYEELKNSIGIEDFKYLKSINSVERIGYLNITFSKGTDNLKNEILAVPG